MKKWGYCTYDMINNIKYNYTKIISSTTTRTRTAHMCTNSTNKKIALQEYCTSGNTGVIPYFVPYQICVLVLVRVGLLTPLSLSQATTPNLLCWRFSRPCSLPRVGYAIFANRDFGQDLRFLRDAREIRKNANIGLCACLRTVIMQSFARRRASRAEE